MDALLGRAGALVDLLRVARVGVHQDELADVVQQRGDHQPVALLVAGLDREALGGALRGDAVEAEALGRGVPDGRALEEVEGAGACGDRLHGLRGEHVGRGDDRVDAAAALALGLVGEAQHGDDERDVALDGGDDLARVDALLADEAQHAVARLGECREALERLEGGREAPAVALVVNAACVCGIGGGVSCSQGGCRTGRGHHA